MVLRSSEGMSLVDVTSSLSSSLSSLSFDVVVMTIVDVETSMAMMIGVVDGAEAHAMAALPFLLGNSST